MGSACSRGALPRQKVEPVSVRRAESVYTDTTPDNSIDHGNEDDVDEIEVARERRNKSKSLQILGIA